MAKTIRLVSWNVNGLRAAQKKGFDLWAIDSGADIICLQETKLQPEQAQTADLPYPYQQYHSATKKGYSGTALLSKIAPLAVSVDFAARFEHPLEGRVLTATFADFYLVTAYVPNAQDGLRRLAYRLQWDADFRNHLVELARDRPVIVCGDFNVAHEAIDLARPEANRRNAGFTDEERGSFTELLDTGFVDCFRAQHPGATGQYTWWSYRGGARSRNVGWRLDYFLVSQDCAPKVTRSWIAADVLGSDHCPVGIELSLS